LLTQIEIPTCRCCCCCCCCWLVAHMFAGTSR
jgi:hypothetical protein